MTITYKRIINACRKDPECKDGYPMVLRGDDRTHVITAVNQGIDSHLEACNVAGRDFYEVKNGGPISGTELHCRVSPESLPVLLRRLAYICDEAHLLASDILESLGIEDGDPFDIISPVDEEAHA